MVVIPVWGAIQALLSEFKSSDDVLHDLRLAGFTGLNLTTEENYSHKTRKRTYLGLADKQFSALSEEERWRVAAVLAREVTASLLAMLRRPKIRRAVLAFQ